jgi:hypothetical protein
MIELIDTQSPRAIGIKIAGKIERPDVDKLRKAIDEKLEHTGKLGAYVELESFGGISLDALVEDLKLFIPYLNKFDKKAVVSDEEWVSNIAEIAGKLVPGIEVRHFNQKQKVEAMEWVRE